MAGNKNSGRKGWEFDTTCPATGRKPAPIESIYTDIEALGRLHCTITEAADYLAKRYRVDLPRITFHHFLERNEKAMEAFECGKSEGKLSLRRQQMKKAEAGDTTMLIWCGKNILGQSDKQEISGNPDNPLVVVEGHRKSIAAKMESARQAALRKAKGDDEG